MKIPAPLLAALALLAAACGEQAAPADAAGTIFPAHSGRVVDQADLLSPADEQRIAAASAAIERETGAQFVVATLQSLHGSSIEDYGVQLARTWGIGRRGHDDGVLLIVAPNERKVRIEVGYGLERRVTDPFAARVIRDRIFPHFRDSRFPAGIMAGSAAIVERLQSRRSDEEIRALDGVVT